MKSNVIVHIVDDDEAVRNSLAFLLMISGYAVRVHDAATEFLKRIGDPSKACLVTDLRMPGMDGVELLKRLRKMQIMIPTIVITGHGDVPMAVEAMKAGALDFIEKPFEEETLLQAVSKAVAAAESHAFGTSDVEEIRGRIAMLSEREQQVMQGVVAGLSNKNIAFNLDISPRTVEVHRANVMAKMNCKSLPELVRMALQVEEGT